MWRGCTKQDSRSKAWISQTFLALVELSLVSKKARHALIWPAARRVTGIIGEAPGPCGPSNHSQQGCVSSGSPRSVWMRPQAFQNLAGWLGQPFWHNFCNYSGPQNQGRQSSKVRNPESKTFSRCMCYLFTQI